jgi:hypothetical protein
VGCRRGGGGESVASYEYGRRRYRGDGGGLIEVGASWTMWVSGQ